MAQSDDLTRLARFACDATLATLGLQAIARTRSILADCVPVIAAGMQQPGCSGSPRGSSRTARPERRG